MKFSCEVEEKEKDVTFREISCGEVFAHGGWLTMKCVIDGSHFNAVHLESGNAVAISDHAIVRPIDAILVGMDEYV